MERKDWKKVSIGKICNVETGTTPSTKVKDYWEDGLIKWVTPTDLSKLGGKMTIKDTERKITEQAVTDFSLKVMPKGSIIVSSRAPIGYIAILEDAMAFNQGCKGLIIRNQNEIDNFYLSYQLLTKVNKMKSLGTGSTFSEISKSQIENLQVFLPPLTEQKKIAEILSTVDEAIEKVNEAIKKTERLKKGLMQDLLTKGIGHKEFKDTEIGRIPKEWVYSTLGELIEVHDSKRIPLSEMERAKRKGKYPYCGANGIMDYIDDYIFDGEFLLIAEDGGAYGKFENSCYLMNGKFWVNNHAHIIKAKDNQTINKFLFYMLNFQDLRPYIVGSTRRKLNQEYLRQIYLPLPPLTEQKQIAEILGTVDERLEVLKNKKQKFEKIKKGLMNDLLTGRRRVKV
ncbi:MAG TPA: restriction endonuclease subunit S [candidate division WOR-3 bacterium]|uniref:Restriction endonuclease subunit S n=1 Tax=candidate division WOR-3 bacterium TaxID=2052148 RepID=A0A9C9K0J5_UNCW3|nr:restriction endonuclease subunit S [candidate division WOR-3 bacterium]